MLYVLPPASANSPTSTPVCPTSKTKIRPRMGLKVKHIKERLIANLSSPVPDKSAVCDTNNNDGCEKNSVVPGCGGCNCGEVTGGPSPPSNGKGGRRTKFVVWRKFPDVRDPAVYSVRQRIQELTDHLSSAAAAVVVSPPPPASIGLPADVPVSAPSHHEPRLSVSPPPEADHEVTDGSSTQRVISECYFTVKGAALVLPQNECGHVHRNTNGGDIQQHLQSMLYLLRQEDTLKMAVKLESFHSSRTRYLVVVLCGSTVTQDTDPSLPREESCLLGVDCNEKTTIGLVLPVWADTNITLDGDGGFSVKSNIRQHIFKPVSVQAMWSALQTLHKASAKAREQNHFSGGSTHSWVQYYEQRIESDRSCRNEWDAMDDLESRRPPSPGSLRSRPQEQERTEMYIKSKLKEIMMAVDLDEVTSKHIRSRLEEELKLDLSDYKRFIDDEMLTILGQMDAATQVFDYLYLGSEWNASNSDELHGNGIGHILNVTREIDNFFPGVFEYCNIRVYDDDSTDLLKYWDCAYKFIVKAREQGSKVLVHCKMGVSRSASVVIAYAMKAYSWSLQQALEFVKQKRSCVKPNQGFLKQLEIYQGILDASKQRHNSLWRSKSETNLKLAVIGSDVTDGLPKNGSPISSDARDEWSRPRAKSATSEAEMLYSPTPHSLPSPPVTNSLQVPNLPITQEKERADPNRQRAITFLQRCIDVAQWDDVTWRHPQPPPRPKSWSPDERVTELIVSATNLAGPTGPSSFPGLSTPSGCAECALPAGLRERSSSEPTSRCRNHVRLPCDNGQAYSVSPNKAFHLSRITGNGFNSFSPVRFQVGTSDDLDLAISTSFSSIPFECVSPLYRTAGDSFPQPSASSVKKRISELQSQADSTPSSRRDIPDKTGLVHSLTSQFEAGSAPTKSSPETGESSEVHFSSQISVTSSSRLPVEEPDVISGSLPLPIVPSPDVIMRVRVNDLQCQLLPTRETDSLTDLTGKTHSYFRTDEVLSSIKSSTSAKENPTRVASCPDTFSDQLDHIFDNEETNLRKRDLSGNPPSRQDSWSSSDSAVLRNSPPRHWEPKPKMETGLLSSPELQRSIEEMIGHVDHSPLHFYEQDSIPWAPGTVKRTTREIETHSSLSSLKRTNSFDESLSKCKAPETEQRNDEASAMSTSTNGVQRSHSLRVSETQRSNVVNTGSMGSCCMMRPPLPTSIWMHTPTPYRKNDKTVSSVTPPPIAGSKDSKTCDKILNSTCKQYASSPTLIDSSSPAYVIQPHSSSQPNITGNLSLPQSSPPTPPLRHHKPGASNSPPTLRPVGIVHYTDGDTVCGSLTLGVETSDEKGVVQKRRREIEAKKKSAIKSPTDAILIDQEDSATVKSIVEKIESNQDRSSSPPSESDFSSRRNSMPITRCSLSVSTRSSSYAGSTSEKGQSCIQNSPPTPPTSMKSSLKIVGNEFSASLILPNGSTNAIRKCRKLVKGPFSENTPVSKFSPLQQKHINPVYNTM